MAVYASGEKCPGRFFFTYFLPNALPWSRLGVTVSRKVGNPVRRNRIRRKLREIFRLRRSVVGPGVDVVLNVKRSADGADYWSLEREFVKVAAQWKSRSTVGVPESQDS